MLALCDLFGLATTPPPPSPPPLTPFVLRIFAHYVSPGSITSMYVGPYDLPHMITIIYDRGLFITGTRVGRFEEQGQDCVQLLRCFYCAVRAWVSLRATSENNPGERALL